MISAVSSVNFRGETDNKDLNALISSPGKYASAPSGAQQAPESDQVDLSTSKKEKNNTGAIIGGIIGALALAWIGLGVAVGRKASTWTKIEAPEGIGQKAKNFFHMIGDSAVKAYDNTLGRIKALSRNADEVEVKVKPDVDPGSAGSGEPAAS